MSRFCLLLFALLLGVGQAAVAVDELSTLYDGEKQLPKNIVMGFWGYRPIGEKEGNPFVPMSIGRGVYGLKMVTLGRYSGVRFDLPEPLDLSQFIEDKNVFLEIYLRSTDAIKPVAAETDEESPAAGEGEKQPISVPLPKLKNIRFTLVTEEGQGVVVVSPEQFFPKQEVRRNWVRIGVPLFSESLKIGGKLTRFVVTSDEPAQFMVGRLAFVRDSDPLQASVFVYPPFLEAKKRIFLAARVDAGLSPYRVEWDLNTSPNEASVDAIGDRVTYTYPSEGIYTITCTISDTTGVKAPVVSVVEVKISRPYGE